MAKGQTEDQPKERTLFGHPIGLVNLFGVELWERFSFYGMLTILGYYLYYSVTEGGLGLPWCLPGSPVRYVRTGQLVRISARSDGSTLPPDTTSTVGPGGVSRLR